MKGFGHKMFTFFLRILEIVRKIIRPLGVDIVRYPYPLNEMRRQDEFEVQVKILSKYNIDLVLDVGANTGQYAKSLIDAGYKGKVVSFEPLSEAYQHLVINAKAYPNWQIAPRCAIGDFDGEIDINISKNLQSSSVLPMMKENMLVEPMVEYIGVEKVKIYKLSTIAKSHIDDSALVYLKIDVQGLEEKVISGVLDCMPKVKAMAVEMSMLSLYGGQVLIEEMISQMRKLGFLCQYLYPVFWEKDTGKLLQVDGIFVK